VILEAAKKVVDRFPLPIGKTLEDLGAILETVAPGVVFIEAITSRRVEFHAQGLD
jgi:hypothetical protein